MIDACRSTSGPATGLGASLCVVWVMSVQPAVAGCDTGGGTCCAAHTEAGCADRACCIAVCDIDPLCCDAAWDQTCADHAAVVCPLCVSCQLAKLLPADGAAGDEFGYPVAVSGDAAVVGAPTDHYTGTCPGAAYIFRFNGKGWVQEAKLLAADGAAGDQFGYSVAVSGDVAVVGAPHDDDGGTNSGSAYVFRRHGPAWVQETKLLGLQASTSAEFGFSVAVSSEVVVVGSPFQFYGRAYIYRFDGSLWVHEATLISPQSQSNAGWSVAVSGDVAIVGAPGFQGPSVRIFRYDGRGWVQQAGFPGVPGHPETTGWAVAVSGEVAVAMLEGESNVFRYGGTSWVLEAALPGTKSLAAHGDRLVRGSQYDNSNGTLSGSAYVVRFDGSQWVPQAKLLADDGAAGDQLGRSVALSGGFAVVGAPYDDDNGADSGSAYVFGLSAGTCKPCAWDLDFDVSVGVMDFLALLGAWGTSPGGPPDFDGDGIVGLADFVELLANWGPCPGLLVGTGQRGAACDMRLAGASRPGATTLAAGNPYR